MSRLRCQRCGARMYCASPDLAECLLCGHHVALISRSALLARRQLLAEARADAQSWVPKRGRPRKERGW